MKFLIIIDADDPRHARTAYCGDDNYIEANDADGAAEKALVDPLLASGLTNYLRRFDVVGLTPGTPRVQFKAERTPPNPVPPYRAVRV